MSDGDVQEAERRRNEIAEAMQKRRDAVLNERMKNQDVRKEASNVTKDVLENIAVMMNDAEDAIKALQASSSSSEFDAVVKKMQAMEKYLAENASAIPLYEVKRIQREVSAVDANFKSVQDALRPKKKFGFKGNKKSTLTTVEKKAPEPKKEETTKVSEDMDVVIKDRKNEMIVITKEKLVNVNGDVLLKNLVGCEIRLLGVAGTVHVTNLESCKVLMSPVKTSVFIDECRGCDFVVACQQLRTHKTRESRFYVHVTSKAIIEDCAEVEFAPYDLTYDALDEAFAESGLNRAVNNWNDVDDFNWLASNEKSPNWHILAEEKRQRFEILM